MGFYDYNKIPNNESQPKAKDYNGYQWLEERNQTPIFDLSIFDEGKKEQTPTIVDGKIWDCTSQGSSGDCYLLATSNISAQVENGEKAIQEQVYREELSGMVAVEMGGKTYYFTNDEIRNAEHRFDFSKKFTEDGTYIFGGKTQIMGRLSSGDDDLIAIELAYEQTRVEKMLEMFDVAGGKDKYKAFAEQIKKARSKGIELKLEDTVLGNNKEFIDLYNKNKINGIEILDIENPLKGGHQAEFAKTMFGDKVKTLQIVNANSSPKEIFTIQAQNTTGFAIAGEPNTPEKAKILSEIQKNQRLQLLEMLKSQAEEEANYHGRKYPVIEEKITSIKDFGDPKKDAMVVDFIENKGEMYAKHAFAIKDENEKYVTLLNPWFAYKDIKIPREEFYDNLQSLTVINFKDNGHEDKNTQNNKMEIIPKEKKEQVPKFSK